MNPAQAKTAEGRPCTCHPDDNPLVPCARKYALQDCLSAAISVETKPVGDWVMVPREPTQVMMDAGADFHNQAMEAEDNPAESLDELAIIYRAMLAAAPASPQPLPVETKPVAKKGPITSAISKAIVAEYGGSVELAECVVWDALQAMPDAPEAPQPLSVETKPVAWLKTWTTGSDHCQRVDLHPRVEPWLAECNPTITPLYAFPQPILDAPRVKKLVEEIRELNMTGEDENGHRWSNSDLIDQTCMELLSAIQSDGAGK